MITEDKVFTKADDLDQVFRHTEFENCQFNGCDMSARDLAKFVFVDCQFTNCNLGLAKLTGTVMRDCLFTGCKMTGIGFEAAQAFGFSARFDQCLLDHSSFYQRKLVKTTFTGCRLTGVDFTDCDLEKSVFDDCDLQDATFDNSNLEQCDFRTSKNFSINPSRNRIKKARFSIDGLPGLLEQFNIIIEGRR